MTRRKGPAHKQNTVLPKTLTEQKDTTEIRKEFYYYILQALDSRREAIDSRSSLCLALSTTSLVLIISLYSNDNMLKPINSLHIFLYCTIIITLSISVVLSILLVIPIRKYNKAIKNKKGEVTVYSWFYAVARVDRDMYVNAALQLSQDEIMHELASQIHAISLLLDSRYNRLSVLCWFLNASLVLVVLYIGVIIFGGSIHSIIHPIPNNPYVIPDFYRAFLKMVS